MQWFDHSSTASLGDEIGALRMAHPDSAAVDLYWAIVEKQYRDEASVLMSETDLETKAFLYRLLLGFDVASGYVETMLEIGLLKRDEEGRLYSQRAKSTIDAYLAKAETARQNGKGGGRKPKRKPTGKPSAEPTGKPRNANTKQNNTEVGLDKTKPTSCTAPDGADVDGTTPPGADDTRVPVCPLCSGPVRYDARSLLWRCDMCGPVKEPAFRGAP